MNKLSRVLTTYQGLVTKLSTLQTEGFISEDEAIAFAKVYLRKFENYLNRLKANNYDKVVEFLTIYIHIVKQKMWDMVKSTQSEERIVYV